MKTLKYFIIIILVISAAWSCTNMSHDNSDYQLLRDSLNLLKKQTEQVEINKKIVATFYQQFFGDKNVDVIEEYLVENYIQHNPMLPDGRDTLYNSAKLWFKNAPKSEIDIHHLGADGEFVYIHTRMERVGKVYSVIDIFRIEDGKIAEHWDVIQEVPEKSANPHPMF